MNVGISLGLNRNRYRGFIPRDLTGLVLWLRSDIGVTLSGSDVTSWADQSGLGHNATGGSAKPTYSASAGPNNRPAISFTGSQLMTLGFQLPKPATLVAVAKTDGISAAYHGVIVLGTAGTPGTNLFARTNAVQQWLCYQNGNVLSGASLTSYKRIIALVRNYDDIDLRTNGSSVTVATGVSAYGPDTSSVIGAGNASGGQNLEGSIAELIAFNRVLSVSECVRIESYLGSRYAL